MARTMKESVKSFFRPIGKLMGSKEYDPTREHSYFPPIYEMDGLIKPTNGYKLERNTEDRRINTKVRKIKKEKAKISEVMVKLVEKRPYIAIFMADHRKRMALYDTGATTSTIGQKTLEEYEKIVPVARHFDHHLSVSGIVPGAKTDGTEVVYLSFSFDTGYILKNVPMLVIPEAKGIILGSNLAVAYRWSSIWKGDEFFIDMHQNEGPVKAVFLPDSSASAVSVSCINLQPKEKAFIPLQIPILDGLTGTNFHTSDLLATAIDEDGILKITPSVTKLNKETIMVQVQNTSEHPFAITEPMEIAKVEIIQDSNTSKSNSNLVDITPIRQIKHKFDQITVVETEDCFCKIVQSPTDPSLIQLADRYGLTSTVYNPVDVEGGFLQEYAPGIHLHCSYNSSHYSKPCLTPRVNLLIVPDEDGSYSSITRDDMDDAKQELECIMKKGAEDPNEPQKYFFPDPLLNLSLETMEIMVLLHEVFNYKFLQLGGNTHPECVHIAAQSFPGEVLAGTMETRLHIQTCSDTTPPELQHRDKGTPIFKTRINQGVVSIFRLGIVLNCIVYFSPTRAYNEQQIQTQLKQTLYITMSELRTLRVPTNFRITMDIGDSRLAGDFDNCEYHWRKAIINTFPMIKPFMKPNSRCDVLVQNFETEQMPDINGQKQAESKVDSNSVIELFKGDVSELTNPGRIPRKQKFSQLRAIISNMTAVDETEFDTPVDPLGLVDEEATTMIAGLSFSMANQQ